MLQSIVGPPLKGVADFKSSGSPNAENSRDEKKAGSDSFGQMLKRDEAKPGRAEPERSIQESAPDKIVRADQEGKRRPESDEKVEQLRAIKDNGEEKKVKGSSQRQNAILNFMDSFESEFGVPPTRIVEAMANLEPTDQAEAPEATADQVIGQLGLDDRQEDQAKAMYVGLLAQLAQINQNAQQPLAPPKAETEVIGIGAGQRFATAHEKREVLNQSLDSMNQKFWMKGANVPREAGGEVGLADKLAQMNMQEKMTQPQSQHLQLDESLMNAKYAEVAKKDPAQGIAQETAQDTTQDSVQDVEVMATAAAAVPKTEAREVKAMASEFEDSSSEGIESSVSKEPLSGKSHVEKASVNIVEGSSQGQPKGFEFGKNQQQQDGSTQSQGHTAKGEILAKTKSAEKSDFKKTLGLEGFQDQRHLKQEIATGATTAGASAAAAPSKAENEANVRQLMNQAQYLIKKGGGEMKIEMTPEGMGKINMKVLVQDGKVNVQMSADTQEAKKTLESSLSDLKNSLAAHKLSMDHIKIDVVAGTNTENNTQNQMNQHQGTRDQTRQFWNNFSENFGSPNQQREGFTDLPNLRGYPRPRTDQGIEPAQTARANNYAAAGKGKGLNLVA